jgi:hypothetical protein
MTNKKRLLALSIVVGLLTAGCGGSIPQEVEPDTAEIASVRTSCGGGGQACCANSVCNSGFSCVSNVRRENDTSDVVLLRESNQ